MIDNNICETFNSYIRKGREKPLIDMLEYIKENLMEMMEKQVRIMKSQRYNMSHNKEEVGRYKKQYTTLHCQAYNGGDISSGHVQGAV